jgi:hypothetical protein
MSNDLNQFEAIIAQLSSTNNAARNAAEAAFNETKKNPEFLTISLIHLVRGSQHETVRIYYLTSIG